MMPTRSFFARARGALAHVIYVVGILSSLGLVVSQLGRLLDQGFGQWLIGSLYALAAAVATWWITAGIAIRLGVFPIEFFTAVGRWLGLGYDPPIPDARRVPPRPTEGRDI